jgi:hypothetical protein
MKRWITIFAVLLMPGIVFAGDTLFQGADNVSNTKEGWIQHVFKYSFDGTYWDRDRSTSGATHVDLQYVAGSAVTAGAGAVAAGTLRVTLASDDPAVTALEIIDDWDETNRAAVNLIAAQAGITAGAGNVAANTPRVTLAADDPAVVDLAAIEVLQTAIEGDTTAIQTAVEIMDDWDETNRAAVNLIAGQVAITAGAGAVGTNTPRVTLASDDPAVVDLAAIEVLQTAIEGDTTAIQTAIEIIDDWDSTQGSAVGADGPMSMFESKDQDGAAFPNTVTEGQSIRGAASESGVQYVQIVSEDGSLAPAINTAGADGAANTDDAMVVECRHMGWNGASWDRVEVDNNDYLKVIDASTRAGEDTGNDWRKAQVTSLDENTTTETEGADTIAAVAVDIFDPVDISDVGSWCLYIKNTDAADAFTDLDILTNYEDANWDDAVELVQTVCVDTLAADTLCVYCVSNSAYKFIKVSATGQANPNESSSSVSLVENKG